MFIASDLHTPLLAYTLTGAKPEGSDEEAAFRSLVSLHGPLGSISACCFLLYRPTSRELVDLALPAARKTGVNRLIYTISPQLMQQLSRVMEKQRVLMHGRTRGKIDWSTTYKARLSEDNNPTVFVCQQSWRCFDRPENQLVKYLLSQMQTCLGLIPGMLREWQAWGRGLPGEETPLHLGGYFARLAQRIKKYLGFVAMQNIALPVGIETRQILAARTSKNEMYAEVADLYELYRSVVLWPDWAVWKDVVTNTLPFPPTTTEAGRYVLEYLKSQRRV